MNQSYKRTENVDDQTSLNENHMSQRRHRPDPSLLRLLRGAMVIIGGTILLVGMLLIILPMFRVSNILVVGASYYTEEEIIAASGITVGDEILMIDRESVYNNIWEKLPYVNAVNMRRFFNTVKITVEENTNLMYTEFVGKYYVLNRDFRVLTSVEDESELKGIVRVELPEIAALGVGSQIRFENEALDTGYILDLLDSLEKGSVLSRVSAVDVSKKFNVSYVMDDYCRVELGKVGDMSLKLTLVEEILTRRGTVNGAAVVNVSDLNKPTYRTIDALI